MADVVESIVARLESNEKIIQIVSESIPHLSILNDTSSSGGSSTNSRRLLSTSNTSASSSPQSPHIATTLIQSMSNGTNLNQLASDSTSNAAFDLSNQNDDYIKKLFAKQLLTLKECNKQTHPEIFKRYPNIKLWLKLLNISKSSIDAILLSSLNFHDLYEMQSETELNSLFQANGVVGVLNENELKTLFNAFQNLKHCYTNVEQQKQQQQQQNQQQQQVPQQQQEVIVKIQPSSSASTSTIATSSSSASSSPSNPSSSSSSSSMLASSCNESSMNSRPPVTTKTSTTAATNPTNPTINTNNSLSSSSRCKQQRKSESDVQIDSVQVNRPGGGVNHLLTAANANQSKSNTAGVLLSTNDVGRNYYLTSSSSAATVAANSQQLQQPVQKNVAFSPIVKNNKKTSGPKVTTPPPSRKLSTGNTGNLIQLNNPVHLSKALAVSSAASKAASKQQQQQQQQQQQMQQQHIEYDEDSSTLVETSSSMATSPPMTSNMQRSSSHESHLRSKVGGGEQVVPGTDYNNSSSKQSLSMFDDNGPASRRLSEASEMSSKCASSGQASPNLQSPSHYKVNGIFTNGDDYKNNPKSPNQSREHRWSTTYKPANCDICKKRMFFGIKCKNCKFRCHKDCEKKTPQQCSASNLMGMISANGSLFPVATTTSPNQQQQHQYGESPGSNASSTMPSPALSGSGSSYSHHHLQTTSMPAFMSQTSHNNNNNASSSNLSMQSNDSSSTAASGTGGWTSGVVRVANRIVSSFNSGGASAAATGVSSTPRQLHKFQQHAPAGLNLDASQQHTNHLESRSSSSCNSSEPNSPNYFKSQPFHPYHHQQQQQQQQQQQYHLLNQPGIAGGAGMGQSDSSSIIMNKKSSSSSISSASIGYYQQPSNASNSSSLSQQQQAQPSPSVASSHHPYSYIFGNSFGAANSSSFANTLTPVHSIDTTTGSVDTTLTMMPGSRAANASDDYRNDHMEDHDITMTSLAGSQTQNGDDRNISSSTIPTTKIDSASSTTAAGVDSTGSTNDGSGAGSMGGGNGSSGGHHNDTDSDFATAQAVSMNSSHAAQDFQQFSITYEEITGKEEIGRGRFGVVYKAYWHGDVAVKEIETNVSEDSAEMKSFKEEVFNLRKTRHNNLILFIGACLKPPKCAIVMSLCRHGLSLYSYLRSDVHAKPASNIDWLIDLATQIAQGMGYLHNKQLIHKDLRSKNVFIDGCKAIITDFGLYSFTKLCNKQRRDDLLPITKECLYYMAPELVRVIGTSQIEVAFSPASDVFSFGTLWYELFSCDYPFSLYSTDTVVYLMGNGLKNLSPNIQIPKEFKVILMKCWSKEPSTRPDFSRLLETFRAIPKKSRLFRSPSHPVHIGRSLEGLNAYNQMGNNGNG